MPEEPRRRALGRGLSALMADLEPEGVGPAATVNSLPIEAIRRNPEQPRRTFDTSQIADLAASISEKGLLQPIIVRADPKVDGEYQIVAGERRWRAAQEARLHEVPVVVRDLTDAEVFEIAIIENVQRVDLNPLEEAAGFQILIDRFEHTQEQVAKALGKSRSHIANLLRLLKLPDEVQEMVREGRLTAGHARALLTASDPISLAQKVVENDLSVREVERLAKDPVVLKVRTARTKKDAVPEDADTAALANDLSAALGLRVNIAHKGDGSGALTIAYRTLADLDQLCDTLSETGRALAAK